MGSNFFNIKGEKKIVCVVLNINGVVVFDFIIDNSLIVNFIYGNGLGRVVVMCEGSFVSNLSVFCNGLSYIGSSIFGVGD